MSDYDEGRRDGAREIVRDHWTTRTATVYLEMVGDPISEYDRGHQDSVRTLLGAE